MLGKGGNTFAFGGRMLPVFDQPSPYANLLRGALEKFFPAFTGVDIAATWNGPSDRSITGLPFFGRMGAKGNIFYGFGYSGSGVGPCHMGGQILSSLVLGLDNPWTRSPLLAGPLGHFPPEPIRYLGSLMVRNAIRRKEHAEDLGRRPRRLDVQLACSLPQPARQTKPDTQAGCPCDQRGSGYSASSNWSSRGKFSGRSSDRCCSRCA